LSLFIVLEGGEGSGKTTHTNILWGRLCQGRYQAVMLHEPGDTALGVALRTLVTAPRATLFSRWHHSLTHPLTNSQLAAKDLWLPITPEAELLLFAAARAQLVAEKLKPLLGKGLTVVCDRYTYSTVAYQAYGHGLDLKFVAEINERVTQGIQPDLVILLDIEPSRGLARKSRTEEISKFEVEDLAFHQRVRQAYLEMAQKDAQRWFVVDASKPKAEVSKLIWERVEGLLPRAKRRVSLRKHPPSEGRQNRSLFS
jgi:dTMP kinase